MRAQACSTVVALPVNAIFEEPFLRVRSDVSQPLGWRYTQNQYCKEESK